MSDEAAFLRAILANPGDTTVRLVYADWLEERGDTRAAFLRLDAEFERQQREGRSDAALNSNLAEAAAGVDPAWRAFVTTLGRPFSVGPQSRTFLDIEPADLPFSDRIGLRGTVVTFGSQFARAESWQPGLLEDLRIVTELDLGECAYGAASLPVYPFICELDDGRRPLTGAVVLAALKARQFSSEHIPSLDATSIPYPGYHAYTDNDEIHNDFASQYIFEHEQADESSGNHGALKRYVAGGQLWYVLLHPTKRDGFAAYAVLLAVGMSPDGKRLVGVITHQVCHNLCD